MSLLVPMSIGACSPRVAAVTCEWPSEGALRLNLSNATEQQHLTDDALVAEDRAIRYADATRGHRSAHFETAGDYARTRDECMARMFAGIAASHGVAVADVRGAMGRRRFSVDLAVLLSMALFYGLAADRAARWVLRSFPFGSRWLVLLAIAMASVVVSAGGLALGGLWAGLVEMIRIGNDHVSYRVGRSPWSRHQVDLFVGGLLLFWIFAALRFREGRVEAAEPGPGV